MHMTQRLNKGIPGVFLLLVLVVVCLGITGLANAPVLSDLRVSLIESSFPGDAWVVQLTLDVVHNDNGNNPLAQVSNLTIRAYDELDGQVAEYVDHPFHPHSGSSVNDYPVSIEIPKSASGNLVIEACAKHGNNLGCTTWEGWIPQESSYKFSGGLEFLSGTTPPAVGVFESTHWILSIDACGPMTATLDTLNCRLLCTDLDAEIPTWWRVWDSNADADGELEPGELIDTGWIPVADFIAHWNQYKIEIPAGWSGDINFQVRMERSGVADLAGSYSATLTVDVSDGSQP